MICVPHPPEQVQVLESQEPPLSMQACCWAGSQVGGGVNEQLQEVQFHVPPLLIQDACASGLGQELMLAQLELSWLETPRQNWRSLRLAMEEHCVASCNDIPRHSARVSASARLLQFGDGLVLPLDAP
jgi:hypothetical protein